MNDPHVEALVYVVEHDDSVDYGNATPLHFEHPIFRLTVEYGEARFEPKEHFPTEESARAAIQPFIDTWEFEESLKSEPCQFKLRFRQPKIIDRHPPPDVVSFAVYETLQITDEVSIRISRPYPDPPSSNPMNIRDPDVKTMHTRFAGYRQGHEPLASMSYFCLTVLETKFGSRREAARECKINLPVLSKIGDLTANRGGPQARKAGGTGTELNSQEISFLTQAIAKLILRVAQVAADPNQNLPQISLPDLPALQS